MNAISDSEMWYSKACAQEVWSTGMCFSLFLSPHSQPIHLGLKHTHTAKLHGSLKEIQAAWRHTGPIKASPKKNKLMSRSASEPSGTLFRKPYKKPFKENSGRKLPCKKNSPFNPLHSGAMTLPIHHTLCTTQDLSGHSRQNCLENERVLLMIMLKQSASKVGISTLGCDTYSPLLRGQYSLKCHLKFCYVSKLSSWRYQNFIHFHTSNLPLVP